MKYDFAAAICNMGCKVNSYEAQSMAEQLERAGYQIVDFHEKADVYVVNTCTVTQIAAKKSRQMLHQARHRNPEALVIAAGCYVDRDDSLIQEGLIDLAVPNRHKGDLLAYIEAYRSGKSYEPTGEEPLWITRNTGKTRAFLKVQDGCRQYCSYCIIPYVRGPLNSRPIELCVEEAKGLAESGYHEIVLTGIHLSSYGKGEGYDLADLILALDKVPEITRIRLGSLEPRMITSEWIQKIKNVASLCPHFHLSLQSGSNRTLQAMNRRYTAEEYAAAVDLLREAYPDVAITTDIIVGFPGETEEDHQESMAFVQKLKLAEAHVFRYSAMEGTVAAKREDQIDGSVKRRRSEEMIKLTDESQQAFLKTQQGKKVPVLLEEPLQGSDYWTGHTRNYVRVAVPMSRDNREKPEDEVYVLLDGYLSISDTETILKGVLI